jgi:hypothetical protein
MEGEDKYNKQERSKDDGFLNLECYQEKDIDIDVDVKVSQRNIHKTSISEEEKRIKIALNMQKGIEKLIEKKNYNPDKFERSIDMLYHHLRSAVDSFPENNQLQTMLTVLQSQYKTDKTV